MTETYKRSKKDLISNLWIRSKTIKALEKVGIRTFEDLEKYMKTHEDLQKIKGIGAKTEDELWTEVKRYAKDFDQTID